MDVSKGKGSFALQSTETMMLMRKKGQMETARLVLRSWEQRDFQDFLKFAADPEVMLASGSKPVENAEEAELEFQRALRDTGCYAIVLKETGRPIGKIKFQKDIRRFKVNSLSIGYELAKAYWGNGYMPEALSAMIRCAFEEKKLDVLAIGHFTVNRKSKRVIEKCGFRHEGTIPKAFMRFDGVVFDDESYSILKEEYFANPERFQRRILN